MMVNNSNILLHCHLDRSFGLSCEGNHGACALYSGTPLTQSPRSQKDLTLLMGDLINNGFHKKMYGRFAERLKKWL